MKQLLFVNIEYQKPLHSSGSQRGYSPLEIHSVHCNFCITYDIPPEKKRLPKVSSFFAR